MSHATYRVTNETRGHLAQYADDLIDVAAQGNAPTGETVAAMIETILADQHYEPAARDADGRVFDPEDLEEDPDAPADGKVLVAGEYDAVTGEEVDDSEHDTCTRPGCGHIDDDHGDLGCDECSCTRFTQEAEATSDEA